MMTFQTALLCSNASSLSMRSSIDTISAHSQFQTAHKPLVVVLK